MMKLNFKKNPMKIETEKGYKKSYIKKTSELINQTCCLSLVIRITWLRGNWKKIMKLFFFKINNVEGWNKKSAKKNKNKVNLC